MLNPKWLQWAQHIQAIAQSGLTYATSPFDRQRYQELNQVAAEIIAHHTQVDPAVIQNLIDAQEGYATPKVDVRGAVFKNNQILLVREAIDNCWTLPGGWADINESPSHATEREVWEESGYLVQATKLAAVYDRSLHGHPPYLFHSYKLFFLCDLLGGEPTNSVETTAVGFFTEQELPSLSLPRTTPEEIARLFEHHRHLDWPTDFD